MVHREKAGVASNASLAPVSLLLLSTLFVRWSPEVVIVRGFLGKAVGTCIVGTEVLPGATVYPSWEVVVLPIVALALPIGTIGQRDSHVGGSTAGRPAAHERQLGELFLLGRQHLADHLRLALELQSPLFDLGKRRTCVYRIRPVLVMLVDDVAVVQGVGRLVFVISRVMLPVMPGVVVAVVMRSSAVEIRRRGSGWRRRGPLLSLLPPLIRRSRSKRWLGWTRPKLVAM